MGRLLIIESGLECFEVELGIPQDSFFGVTMWIVVFYDGESEQFCCSIHTARTGALGAEIRSWSIPLSLKEPTLYSIPSAQPLTPSDTNQHFSRE
jgi:hypothetical protein